jgi:elongation factor P--beta-lysine ligase
LWLHTSPEFAMKRLLVGGSGPIFQFARVWRNGEASALHAPEFTMLEWYRPGADMNALIDETIALLRAVLPERVTVRGVTTSLAQAERLTVADAFDRYVGADVLATEGDAAALAAQAGTRLRDKETWEDLFFRLLLERIEPKLGFAVPTFLTHWPAAQAALARRDPADPRVAERFELFVCGIELANAFVELTDPVEQPFYRRSCTAARIAWCRLGHRRGFPRRPCRRPATVGWDRHGVRPVGDDCIRGGPHRSGTLAAAGRSGLSKARQIPVRAHGTRRREADLY